MSGFEVIPMILSAGSTLMGAAGAQQSGRAARDAAIYNAQVKEQQAAQAIDQASAVASNEAVKTRQKVAATRAGSIQNGFETSGSVADIIRMSQVQGELEGMTAAYEGTVRAKGFRDGAALDRVTARNAKSAADINTGVQLLSGASKLYTSGRSAFDSLALAI